MRPGAKNALWTGALAGLALLSKFSAVLLLPVMVLTALFGGKGKQVNARDATLAVLTMFLTIWAGYFFEMKPLLKNTPAPEKKEAVYRSIGGEKLVEFAQSVPVPLSTFSSGLVSMAFTRAAGTNAYLMGEWSRDGWWYYYFIAFGIKNTLPFLILFLISLALLPRLGLSRLQTAFLLVPIAFFFTVTLRDKAQAGIRYFLPIYPFCFILAAGAVTYMRKQTRTLRVLAMSFLAWHALESARIYPHYLAYFNQLAGGPENGYRFLRDSNIDWGQDLKGVAEYARVQGYGKVALLTLSPSDPQDYGLASRPLTDAELREPQASVYAIGAHFLDAVHWTRERRPDKVIGHSFFIYDFTHPKN